MRLGPRARHKRAVADIEEVAAQASRCLRDAQNFQVRAEKASTELSKTLDRNHFAEAVALAMQGA